MKEFFTPLEMATKLVRIVAEEVVALHEGMKLVVKKVENTAKNEIGNYQTAKGKFPAWAPLVDSTISEKNRLGYSPPDNPLLRTGTLRDSIKSEVHGNEGIVGSTSQLAIYHEFGTSKMAMRPFIGPAAFTNKKIIKEIVGAAAISGFYEGRKKIHPNLGYDMTTED